MSGKYPHCPTVRDSEEEELERHIKSHNASLADFVGESHDGPENE